MSLPFANNALARWMTRVGLAWAVVFLGFGAVALWRALTGKTDLNDTAFSQQDLPAAGLCFVLMLMLLALSAWPERLKAPRLPSGRRAWLLVIGLAAAAAAIAYAGTFWYAPMTNDETMARFDAVIFAHGRLVAAADPEWRPYLHAMAWQFRVQAPDNAFWASTYLPVAAAFRALFGLLGDQDLANPVWLGVSVVAVFAVARRLWPQRWDAAWLAAGLLLGSGQAMVTGMTAFSMPAHLALNLVWLWLFLRGGRIADAGALGVGALATGLHQFIFHPMFAAPFVLNLWLQRRWKRAVAYTAGYGVIVLFWITWWKWVLPAGASDKGKALGPERWFNEISTLIGRFDLGHTPLMVENLVRFGLWQSLLAVPLAVLALRGVRRDPIVRALTLGAVLMSLAVWVLLPDQGWGWGFRYLHGFIGSLCLLAVFAWIRVSDQLQPPYRQAAGGVLAVSVLLSALVLVPLRFVQTFEANRPYARTQAMIEASPADVVLIDHSGIQAPGITTSNDPFFRNRPKVMMIYDALTLEQLRTLCASHTVEVFDRFDGEVAGLTLVPSRPKPTHAAKQALLAGPACRSR